MAKGLAAFVGQDVFDLDQVKPGIPEVVLVVEAGARRLHELAQLGSGFVLVVDVIEHEPGVCEEQLVWELEQVQVAVGVLQAALVPHNISHVVPQTFNICPGSHFLVSG